MLSIALSIVSNFSRVVEIPHGAVPTTTNDLRKYFLSNPDRPTDVYLVDRRGPEFWIHAGSVEEFRTPGCFKDNQDPEAISKFKGELKLSTNQAISLVTSVLMRLAKVGNPLTNLHAVARMPMDGRDPLPYYWIGWPDPNAKGDLKYAAFAEVDGRKGLITYLDLKHPAFFDLRFAQEISNRVYTPDPVRKDERGRWPLRPPRVRLYPYPTTNQVVEAIDGWLWLCDRLGMPPGTATNVPSVDWELSLVYTNPAISMAMPICQIRFTNHAYFEAINGITFDYYPPDACFVGFWAHMPREEWQQFRGKVVKRWEDLAKDFEHVLIDRLGIPRQLLADFPPMAALGSVGIKRLVVEWRHWPKRQGVVPIAESKLALNAEFDLETGDLKSVNFADPSLIAILGGQQGKTR